VPFDEVANDREHEPQPALAIISTPFMFGIMRSDTTSEGRNRRAFSSPSRPSKAEITS